MVQEIYIIDDNEELTKNMKQIFEKEKEYKFKNVKTQDIDIALKSIPSLIIIQEEGIKKDIFELCTQIREDEDNSITPIIVLGNTWEKEHRI